MKISEQGSLVSIVREGDYLVFRAGKDGVTVEYSPGGSAQQFPVVGAFAARNGVVKYFGAAEAAQILQNYPVAAEDHLESLLGHTSSHTKRSLSRKIIDALITHADAGYAETAERPKWDGRLSDFHKEILYPALGIAYDSNLIRAMHRAAAIVPGVVVAKQDGEVFVTIDWPDLRTEGTVL